MGLVEKPTPMKVQNRQNRPLSPNPSQPALRADVGRSGAPERPRSFILHGFRPCLFGSYLGVYASFGEVFGTLQNDNPEALLAIQLAFPAEAVICNAVSAAPKKLPFFTALFAHFGDRLHLQLYCRFSGRFLVITLGALAV